MSIIQMEETEVSPLATDNGARATVMIRMTKMIILMSMVCVKASSSPIEAQGGGEM